MLILCSVLLRLGVQNTRGVSAEKSKPLGRKTIVAQARVRLLIEEAGCRPRQHPQKFLIFSLALPCRVGF